MQYKLNRVDKAHECINRQAETIREQRMENTTLENKLKQLRKDYDAQLIKWTQFTIKASKQVSRLRAEKSELTQLINKLSMENKQLERENQRRLKMAVVSPDRHFDSRPRKELW